MKKELIENGKISNGMPKEIANKTKEEIHPHTKEIFGVGAYYKCTHCLPAEALAKEGGDEIFWNTHRKLTYCKCKKIWVDGCEDYVRVGGNEGDYKVTTK